MIDWHVMRKMRMVDPDNLTTHPVMMQECENSAYDSGTCVYTLSRTPLRASRRAKWCAIVGECMPNMRSLVRRQNGIGSLRK